MSTLAPDRSLTRLPALDAVRVIGAFAVVAHHVGFVTGRNTSLSIWGGWLARLDVGVAVFFVLSGFLLFRPYAHAQATGERRPEAGRYLWRRAMRILPAYWVVVVVCLLAIPRNRTMSRDDWLRHLTLTHIYQPHLIARGLSQTWSLATEAAFYIVLPLIAVILLGRRWRPGRAIVIALAGLLTTASWVALIWLGLLTPGPHTMWLPAYALWFAMGMALAVAHVALRTGAETRWRFLDELGSAPLTCWALALGVLAIATTSIAGPRGLAEPTAAEFGLKMLLYATIATMILLPVAFGPPNAVKLVFGSSVLSWLGAVSYGLFLWHPFVLEWIYILTGRPEFTGDPVSTFLLTAAGGLALAALSYYAIERPLQRWSHQWPRRRPPLTESQSEQAMPIAAS